MTFHKPPLSVANQIMLLSRRGMAIPDQDLATHYLTHINYYRLRAYWLPFETTLPGGEHQFRTGTTFSDVIGIYQFDRALRLLLLDAIERIEISLRSRWANHLSLNYGAFAHHEGPVFQKQDTWQRCCDELDKEFQRSHETFAKHYQENYNHLKSPPIWVSCELMSIGHLSRWIHNLRKPHDRQAIADSYGLDEKVLVSFLHHLTIVRNHCAHHGRIWNRRLTVKMRLPSKKPAKLSSVFNRDEDAHGRLYNTLAMLAYLLRIISPESHWRNKLIELLDTCPQALDGVMGFPVGWRMSPLWEEAL
ncbi:Abi family protein [Ferrovum myxofaciens]|uniref:Abi family protein n=1 Tax=Ferrovum myxofaciens TaxID=416213 RepID=UPI0004E1DFB5|nr:Abi family protein [Ferrovum myxofaciens]MBU6994272.1 Abi family protein [Ferrovum myxofaciens]